MEQPSATCSRGVGFVTRMPILLKLRQVNFENSVGIRLIR